jgi:hypothetical protein
MSKKYSDLVFGKLKEVEIKEILEGFLNTKLNTSSKYNLIDFYNDDIYIELKSRRNTYQTYNTTIIGSNKIEYAKSLNKKKCYFVFCYLDGLYYIEYSNIFDSFDLCEEYILRDGRKEMKINYHIPIECLTKIDVTVSIQSIRFDV